jgi:Flp pilus assembly pilin Flp
MSSSNPGAGGALRLRWRTWAGDERGAGVVEYALLISLLAVVSLAALTWMGGSIRDLFVAIGERIVAAWMTAI